MHKAPSVCVTEKQDKDLNAQIQCFEDEKKMKKKSQLREGEKNNT